MKTKKIRQGQLDFKLPKQNKSKAYIGTETRDKLNGWNVSSEISRKDLQKSLDRYTEQAV